MQTIIGPTDCNALSRNALRYADRIAARTGASVIAVFGSAFSARIEGEGVAGSLACADDLHSMTAPIRKCMDDAIAECLSADTGHEIVIEDELLADAIVRVANARNADLIIMGTHDRNRLLRTVLGSVTDAVLHRSNGCVTLHAVGAARPRTIMPHAGGAAPVKRDLSRGDLDEKAHCLAWNAPGS